jgi:CRISPR-associated protein Cas1
MIIDQPDCQLIVEGRRLRISQEGKHALGSAALRQLDCVILLTNVTLSSKVLEQLAHEGVSLLCVPRSGNRLPVIAYGEGHGNNLRRVQQVRFLLEAGRPLEAARQALVRVKVRRNIRMLNRAILHRPDQSGRLGYGVHQLEALIQRLESVDLESLLGYEGAAAREYYCAFARVLPEWAGFKGRNKRPPRDPANALLSLGYTLLYHEAVRALLASGLDPAIGFYHQTCYNRQSLACDLVEPLRTEIDYFVWRLMANQDLREHHFGQEGNATLLKKSGREIFYRNYAMQRHGLERKLRMTARAWARNLDTTAAGKQ